MTDLSKELEEFIAFSKGGTRYHPTRKAVPLFPSRNYLRSHRILQHMHERSDEGKTLRSFGFNLGQMVASTIVKVTENNLPGAIALEIINAGRGHLCMDHAFYFEKLFPGSLELMGFSESSPRQANFNYLVPLHAKIILWLEVLSFLVFKDYDLALLEAAH